MLFYFKRNCWLPSLIILTFVMKYNASVLKKKIKYMQAIRKFYSTQKPDETSTESIDSYDAVTFARYITKASYVNTPKMKHKEAKKEGKMKAKDNKVYPTMFPHKPPRNYTEPMIYPKIYLRFLVSGGFLLNFTDLNRYDNIHDAYLVTGQIYNRETNEVREKIHMGEFWKSGGRWVYIRPDFGLRRGDRIMGTMWYQYCIYEDDWMNYLYNNYTDEIKIDVDRDNQTMNLVAKYYF